MSVLRIFYPYNENLPIRMAHDAYVWRTCVGLAQSGTNITLACGFASKSVPELAVHYGTGIAESMSLARLPILRKNWGLPFTWNRVFEMSAQAAIRSVRPDVVLLSVRKLGRHLLGRKRPDTLYAYEVHELEWYPSDGPPEPFERAIRLEREMLAQADVITVTTDALKSVLRAPPYELSGPIAIVPLGLPEMSPLAPITHSLPLVVGYIGTLYEGQGVQDLIQAIAQVPKAKLVVVGGAPDEIIAHQRRVPPSAVGRVDFLGFVPPGNLATIAAPFHVFAAPFRNERAMPYAAHTKLLEYAAFQRPVVAPDLPIVHEYFPDNAGLRTYAPGNIAQLARALESLTSSIEWSRLMQGIATSRVTSLEERSHLLASTLEDERIRQITRKSGA